MKKRYISFLLSAVLVPVMVFTGCSKGADKASGSENEAEEKVTKLAVTVTRPEMGDIEVEGEFSGTLEYADEVSVFPKLSGEVTDTRFEEGDFVNAGDLMFTLDDESYQMTLRNAQAAYDSAKAGIDQQLGAMQKNRDSAENSLITAQEGIGQAENTYGYYQEQYSDLEDKKSDIEEDKQDLKDDKKSVKKKYKKAKTALRDAKDDAQEAKEKYDAAKSSGASESELKSLKSDLDQANAAVTSAQTNVNTLKSSLSTMENGIDSYDDAIDQLESSEDTLNYQMRNLNYSYEQAKRGTALAQENLDYFDMYTMPGTIRAADANLRQVEVGVDSAKLQLEYTQVKAPVSGYIKTKSVDKYDMIGAGATAYVIASDNAVVAAFNVPENVARQLVVGQEIKVERNNSGYEARISEISQTLDEKTGLFKIKATVDAGKDELSTGTAVKITAMTNHVNGVLTVPVDCVYYTAGEAYTYVVEDGIVRKVGVTTGLYDNDRMEILEGLDPDMQVVTVWSSDLRDGLEVDVEEVNEERAELTQEMAGEALVTMSRES